MLYRDFNGRHLLDQPRNTDDNIRWYNIYIYIFFFLFLLKLANLLA